MDLCWRRNAFSSCGFLPVRYFEPPLQYGASQSHQFPYPSTFHVLLSGIAIALLLYGLQWSFGSTFFGESDTS